MGAVRSRRLEVVLVTIVATAGASYAVASKTSPVNTIAGQSASSASNRNPVAPQQPKVSAEQQGSESSSSSSSVNATIHSNTAASAQTDVTVNGKHVDVPTNGSVHKDMTSSTGSTSVDISHTSSGGDDGSGANLNIDITTQSFINGSSDST